ncbi:Rieske (2Fe-2S) protein [Sphingomonas sp. 2SG]|uniref:Rieske (2Fe-2S) protein n=1 Tax=Sphingomonas sp. 2SG TaxID=2502201 RepID=UPI0010F6B131|nr:Rieske (2Fe-2S) protein [Sphingomonas sp. 2SG]
MATDARTDFWKLRPNAPAPGYRLGPADEIAEDSAREFIVGRGRNAFRLFVVRRDGQLRAYLNVCPHYSLPLNHVPNGFLKQGYIECAQHFAQFAIADGRCVSGACEGESLTAIPVAVDAEGMLHIA